MSLHKRKKCKCLPIHLFGLCLVLFFSETLVAQDATDENLCDVEKGYGILFFNGVGNTVKDANIGLLALKKSLGYGDNYNDQPVIYEAFTNTTGSENNSNTLQDVAEVFRQAIAEGDALANNRWQLYWESLGNRNRYSFGEMLRNTLLSGESISAFASWIRARNAEADVKKYDELLSYFFSPPTDADYVRQHTRIKSLALEGKKLLLVAHSQGNLFVNQAYDAALEVEGFTEQSAAVVHIAPASSTLRGEYILADKDMVIGALSVIGGVIIPETNVVIPDSHLNFFFGTDVSGHELVKTYLNSSLETLPIVRRMVSSAIDGLQDPQTEGSEGFFTATLTWDGTGDVDLHIEEPDRNHVYYSRKIGNSGVLDVDNIPGFGPEHYFASCDPEVLQTGYYRFGVNNFSRATGRKYTLQISSTQGGELVTQSNIDVGPALGSAGNSNPNYATGLTVLVTEENGEFNVYPLNGS
jgi:hypothetical protein